LDRNPALLDGERRELTILFSDIRGFSRISEKLSPEDTCALVRDVMERLTNRIREHHGVVVDYIGDAILALWNAPADQPDHALLACRAALAMQKELPGLNERWADRIGGPFGLGIGLNTGEALVGNTGSRSRFKYGPLGHAVNLASRVEGATKQMGVPALITGATHAALGKHDLATRRLCRVAVVGIDHPVDLYELHADRLDPAWQARRDTYEEGLRHFEAGEMPRACRAFHALLEGQEGRYDLPTLGLLGRAIEHLKDPTRPFNPVLKLDTK
jgi:adenylate cyclase